MPDPDTKRQRIVLDGSIDGLMQNVKSILDIIPEDAKIIPGHYESTDKEGLKMTYDMLLETSGIVQEKMVLGQDLDQIKAEDFQPGMTPGGEDIPRPLSGLKIYITVYET